MNVILDFIDWLDWKTSNMTVGHLMVLLAVGLLVTGYVEGM